MANIGDLITPTGLLVLAPEDLGGELWLRERRWRWPEDVPEPAGYPTKAQRSDPRGYRIGSSDVPSILDLDGADTPAHVYRAKVYDVRTEANEAMVWGHLNEPAIALEWCRRNRAVIDEIGLVAKVDEPWRQSTIDRRVRQCPVSRGQEECLLEIKNVDAHVANRWHAEIPDRILAQIVDQLDVTGYGHAHFACLIGGNRMKQGIVWADREIKVRDLIRSTVRRFRADHLLAGVEPEWDVTRKPEKMIELDELTHPERIGTLDIEGIGEVMHYAETAARKSAAEKDRKAAVARLRQLADGKEFVTFAGRPAYRFGESRTTNVNLERLAEKYPDAYADPEVVSETTSHTIYIDKAYKVKGDK